MSEEDRGNKEIEDKSRYNIEYIDSSSIHCLLCVPYSLKMEFTKYLREKGCFYMVYSIPELEIVEQWRDKGER